MIGNTIECTEKVKSAGSTEEVMKETTSTTRNTGMESSYGQMEENTLDTGKTASSMEEESITCPMERKRSENGSRAKRSSG